MQERKKLKKKETKEVIVQAGEGQIGKNRIRKEYSHFKDTKFVGNNTTWIPEENLETI